MFLTVGVTVFLAIALVHGIRRKIDPRVVAIAIWLTVAVLLASSPALRTYSAHGMWHASVVNVLHVAGAPAENPLFAGDALRYPYGFHWLVAKAMYVVPLAPIYWFQFLNLAALALFLWLIIRASRAMEASSGEQVAALVLCILPANPFASVVLRGSSIQADPRSIPFNKFSMINTNQLGFTVLAAIMLLSVQLLQGRSKRSARVGIPLLCCALGFLYPLLWPVAMVWASVLAILAPALRRDWRYHLAIIVSALVVLPFIVTVSSGKAPDASLAVRLTIANVLEVARFLVVPCVLVALATLRSWVPRDRRIAAFLLFSLAGTLGGYLLADGPTGVQYKLLAAAAIPAGLFLAGPLHRLCERPLWVLPVIFALLIHSVAVYQKRLGQELPRQTIVFSGRNILPGSTAEEELTTWIREESESDAVFIDRTKSIPVHGMRSLFAATDSGVDRDEYEGWTYRSSRFVLEVSGTDKTHYEKRVALTKAMLGVRTDAATLKEIASELPGRPIYVVSRTSTQRRRFEANEGLILAAAFPRLALFKLK